MTKAIWKPLALSVSSLILMMAGQVTAQTFRTLYSFTAANYKNTDGANPYAGLLLSGSTLYGTVVHGGDGGVGTVFAINTDGTGFRVLHSFSPLSWVSSGTNSDGAGPKATLFLYGDTLYGTTRDGGSSGRGTIFAVKTNGMGFNTVHNFEGSIDGSKPSGSLVMYGNTLYGTAATGGALGGGTVFAVNSDGNSFTVLHSFPLFNSTNKEGASPYCGLVLSGNTLYGTTRDGGNSNSGTVFKVNTDGASFTTMYRFAATAGAYPPTNSDGAFPYAGLILVSNTLYGTASGGNNWGTGTIFRINTNGTDFVVLHNFAAFTTGSYGPNPEGVFPDTGLMLFGNTLYGTAPVGGETSNGTVFAVNTDGTAFTNLHTFNLSDGAAPEAVFVISGNTLYGTASDGGDWGYGTVFSLSLPSPPPQLTIIHSVENLILTWPNNYSDFTLQSTTNLVSPIWTTNSQVPVIINGQNTVTNPISGSQQFFRLIMN